MFVIVSSAFYLSEGHPLAALVNQKINVKFCKLNKSALLYITKFFNNRQFIFYVYRRFYSIHTIKFRGGL